MPPLPLPAEPEIRQEAAQAAIAFWESAAEDSRINEEFRNTCANNAQIVLALARNPVARGNRRSVDYAASAFSSN